MSLINLRLTIILITITTLTTKKYILVRISTIKVVVTFKLLKSYCESSDMNCNK